MKVVCITLSGQSISLLWVIQPSVQYNIITIGTVCTVYKRICTCTMLCCIWLLFGSIQFWPYFWQKMGQSYNLVWRNRARECIMNVKWMCHTNLLKDKGMTTTKERSKTMGIVLWYYIWLQCHTLVIGMIGRGTQWFVMGMKGKA